MRDETANSLSSDERIVKTEFVKLFPISRPEGMKELEGMLK